MNREEADKQIQQMCAFIIQEAKEKADEIAVKTESEFMADKLNLQTQAGIAIREEHERKKKDKLTEQKIAKSQAVTAARFATMRRRDEKIRHVKGEVMKRLATVSSNPKYPELIRFLLAQSFMTMQEEDVVIHGRKEDLKIIEAQLPEAVRLYQTTIKQATGIEPVLRPVMTKKEDELLPSGPRPGFDGATCCGGIKVSSRAGKIVCRNTLDSRLEIAFKELKPQVRGILFGIRPAPITKAAPPQHGHGH